jgi:hypothetical protein
MPIGVYWLARFIKRHPEIDMKVGKRQEAGRFNSFTLMAVNWYFNIRENEYGWIKPENTVNVDEGGIMAGFGNSSTSSLRAFIWHNELVVYEAWTAS